MNQQIPVISIVTPSYNQASFIGETIESVLSQAGDFRIEYLVMDGGSTDNSADIIRDYADRVSSGDWEALCAGITMFWVSERDKGQAHAINKGMRRCTGDIIAYINSDDAFCPGAFQQVVTAFMNYPQAHFVYGDGVVINSDGSVQWEWLSRPYNHKLMKSYHFLWNDFTNYIMQQATFWRRDVLDQIGYFDETFHYALDVEYWIRAGEMGLNLQHIPVKLGKFRMIPGTKSLSSLTAFWGDQLEIFRRYCGIPTLSNYFAYFYYNLAKQENFYIEKIQTKDPRAFKHWENLSFIERLLIEKQADEGLAKAYLMMANALLLNQPSAAETLFNKGISNRKHLSKSLFAMIYRIRRLLGAQITSRIDKITANLIQKYRWEKYQVRYHKKGGSFLWKMKQKLAM